MSLVIPDVDTLIASKIFGKSQKWNQLLIHRIYYIFGKAQFNDFLLICRSQFLKTLYDEYKTQDFKVVLKKLLRRKNLDLFDCYQTYNKPSLPSEITFVSRNSYHRLVIYYLSVYYGYLHVCVKNLQEEKFGYDYYDFNEKHRDAVIPYHEMKKHRVHNLKYYDLVEVKPQYWNNLYKLKDDVLIYKRGVTTDCKDLRCIRIMDIEVSSL